MDLTKREHLIARLSRQPEPPLVPIDEFFDGNDDLGSIGCNLVDHPGIGAFREVLARLAARPDVEAVYARIAELDPGEGCWPFADTVLVVGTLSGEHLAATVAPLQPDEVGLAPPSAVPEALRRAHRAPVWLAWWD